MIQKGKADIFIPISEGSTHFKEWVAEIDFKTCAECLESNGKIYPIEDKPFPKPPVHQNCRCEIISMRAIRSGNATKDGQNGADVWLKLYGVLPDYYISPAELEQLGWSWGKKPVKYAPGKMLTAGTYDNADGHLPQAPGRVWQEADINYYEGRRNTHRIVWSNDGLIFVTYDHY